MFDEQYVEMITGLDAEQRKLLCARYSRLNEDLRVDLHRRQRELFRDWVAEGKMPPNRGGESNYGALLMALYQMHATSDHGATHTDGLEPKIRKQRKQRLRNSLEKKFMGELVRLREEQNLSWRQLSEHFRKEFKKTVSHTYLKRIYDEYLAD